MKDYVTVRLNCECGGQAVRKMTIEDARIFAGIVLANCDNLRPLDLAVRGEG